MHLCFLPCPTSILKSKTLLHSWFFHFLGRTPYNLNIRWTSHNRCILIFPWMCRDWLCLSKNNSDYWPKEQRKMECPESCDHWCPTVLRGLEKNLTPQIPLRPSIAFFQFRNPSNCRPCPPRLIFFPVLRISCF